MDVESLAAAWKQRGRVRAAAAARQAERDRDSARAAACALVEEFGATGVWLFGSLAWGTPHSRSDVDLAAFGISEGRWSKALARAAGLVGRPVDLVLLEGCSASLRERVMARGIRLDHG